MLTQMRFQFYDFQVRTPAELFDFFPIIHQLLVRGFNALQILSTHFNYQVKKEE